MIDFEDVKKGRFITTYNSSDEIQLRIYCFPYAGGNAQAFLPWLAHCDSSTELSVIQYPGRSNRFKEPPIETCVAMAKAIANEINREKSQPFILLGYSMGGAIAFEVARLLAIQQLTIQPLAIHLCASCPPAKSNRYLLEDSQLLKEIRRIGGVDERLLNDAEMRNMILNVMRNDFKILDTYQASMNSCNSPVHLWVGNQDQHVPMNKALLWQDYCHASVQCHLLEGNHFFIHNKGKTIINFIENSVKKSESVLSRAV